MCILGMLQLFNSGSDLITQTMSAERLFGYTVCEHLLGSRTCRCAKALVDPQAPCPVAILERILWIFLKALVAGADQRLDPGGLRSEHHIDARRSLGPVAVVCRGEWMEEIGIFRAGTQSARLHRTARFRWLRATRRSRNILRAYRPPPSHTNFGIARELDLSTAGS